VQQALRDASDAPGYPTAAGRAEMRAACSRWLSRSTGADVGTEAILPTIGSKEMVAGLPRLLGLGLVRCQHVAHGDSGAGVCQRTGGHGAEGASTPGDENPSSGRVHDPSPHDIGERLLLSPGPHDHTGLTSMTYYFYRNDRPPSAWGPGSPLTGERPAQAESRRISVVGSTR
jgi:hypothetical protein